MAWIEETAKDPELSALHKLMWEGWPPKRSSVPDNLKDYWNYRDELMVENGILLKSHKFIVPKNPVSIHWQDPCRSSRNQQESPESSRIPILERIYQIHFRSNWQTKCTLYQENAPSNPQCFWYISEVLPDLWHTLGTDLFYHRKQDYLVLVDYFSKFLIVRKLPNSTTGAVVKELSITCSEYGIPFIIQSDNGPCYSSQEFQNSSQGLQVTHGTSSPHYPQSNGMAESVIPLGQGHQRPQYIRVISATEAFSNRETPHKQFVTEGTKNHALRAKPNPLLSFAPSTWWQLGLKHWELIIFVAFGCVSHCQLTVKDR